MPFLLSLRKASREVHKVVRELMRAGRPEISLVRPHPRSGRGYNVRGDQLVALHPVFNGRLGSNDQGAFDLGLAIKNEGKGIERVLATHRKSQVCFRKAGNLPGDGSGHWKGARHCQLRRSSYRDKKMD
jgi:hypothetical protein